MGSKSKTQQPYQERIDSFINLAKSIKGDTVGAQLPRFKGVVEAYLSMLQEIRGMTSNTDLCLSLAQLADKGLKEVKRMIDAFPAETRSDLDLAIEDIHSKLKEITTFVQRVSHRGFVARFFSKDSDAAGILRSQQELDVTIKKFVSTTEVRIQEEERARDEFNRAREERLRAQDALMRVRGEEYARERRASKASQRESRRPRTSSQYAKARISQIT